MKRTTQKHRYSLGRTNLLIAGLLGLLPAVSPTVHADTLADKSDQFLAQAQISRPLSGRSAVILQMKGDLTPERSAQLKSLGADVYRHLAIIHAVAVNVPARNLSRLASLPFVAHLSADVRVQKNDEFTVGSSGAGVAFQRYNLTGSGVTVAVIDSGIHVNADLLDPATGKSRVLASVNFVPLSLGIDDLCGHGTHVAGIIAGNGTNSSGSSYFHTFYGIARKANLVSVRVLDATGGSSVSTVVAAVQWVVANRSKYNIRVINLSLGHSVGESYTTDPLCQALEQAWKSGIVVACAAGNNGRKSALLQTYGTDNEGYGTAYGSITSPGNDPYVITVGATKSLDGNRAHDAIATYSGRGPTRLDLLLKPDIVAPGNKVISLRCPISILDVTDGLTNQVPLSAYRYNPPLLSTPNYFTLSGTSMATPVVAGAAALLLQANPNLTPDTIKARLMLSADKWAFPNEKTDACTFGAGYLDISAALNCTVVAGQYALSPSLYRDNQGNVAINTSGIWGANALWGTGISNLNAMWGTNALWGTNTLSSSNALWGTSIWGDNALWGTSSFSLDLSLIVIGGE